MKKFGHSSSNDILDRAAGCLAGVAIGSALSESAADGSDEAAALEALVLAESVIQCGAFDPTHFALNLVDWHRRYAGVINEQTSQVLEMIAAGEHWERASIETQAADPGRAGSDSLVRSAPVALFHHSPDTILIEDSRLCSRVTHPHAECQWACAFANLMIVDLLNSSNPRQAVDNTLGICGHRGDVPQQVLFRAKAAVLDVSPKTPGDHVLDTLECSIWALTHHGSFAETLTAAAELGENTGAIRTQTGAFAGATYGMSSIPDRWMTDVASAGRLADLAVSLINLL